MNQSPPLIRIPTQPARLRLVDLLVFIGFASGLCVGVALGGRHFGIVGLIAGGIIGAVLGLILGVLPGHLLQEQMFRKMQKSSNEELKAMVEQPIWTFWQTLALVNLQVRGEDIQSYLPRILSLLESEDELARLFARDALRLVFTPLAVRLDELVYDPKAVTEDCRNKVGRLREEAPGTV